MMLKFDIAGMKLPQDKREALAATKQEIYRPFTVIVVGLAVLMNPAFWLWDYAIDPVGAWNTPPYRMVVAAILAVLALYLYFNWAPRWKTIVFVLAMGSTQFVHFGTLNQLEGGYSIGIGSLLIWYMLMPLIGVGLPVRSVLISLAVLAVAPVIWFYLGIVPLLPVEVVVLLTWPTAAIVAIIVYSSDLLVLKLIHEQEQLEAAKQNAEYLARTDPLTGINNRRAFFDLAQAVSRSALRYSHPIAMIMMDIDRFKRINDVFGHSMGDEAIRHTATVIAETIRNSDVAGRMGGEEFAILLPETTGAQASELAGRLQQAIKGITIPSSQGDITFSVSLGVSSVSGDDENTSIENLLDDADRALLQAKESGRDRIVNAS